MICSCCDKQKQEIHPKKSRVLPGQMVFLCNECITEKREPRHNIILAGRTFGFDTVSEFIKNKRYCGEDIPASDFV